MCGFHDFHDIRYSLIGILTIILFFVYQFHNPTGINTWGEIIKKAGSWYSYQETKLGQGRDAVKQLLKDNVELMEEIEQKILDKLKESK